MMSDILFSTLSKRIILPLLTLFMLTGCNTCCPECELNNFTVTPKEHVYQISGSVIASALKLQTNNTNCNPPQNFRARVMLSVRTASYVNGQAILDPIPYHEIDDDFDFEKNSGSNSPEAKIKVKVPETGAYGIVMTIEIPNCSNCCNGGLDIHCSSEKTLNSNGTFTCKTGKPKLAFEKTFRIAERPDSRDNTTNVNLAVSESMLQVRKCFSCSTCTNSCN